MIVRPTEPFPQTRHSHSCSKRTDQWPGRRPRSRRPSAPSPPRRLARSGRAAGTRPRTRPLGSGGFGGSLLFVVGGCRFGVRWRTRGGGVKIHSLDVGSEGAWKERTDDAPQQLLVARLRLDALQQIQAVEHPVAKPGAAGGGERVEREDGVRGLHIHATRIVKCQTRPLIRFVRPIHTCVHAITIYMYSAHTLRPGR